MGVVNKKKAVNYKPKQKNEIRLSSYLVKKKNELGKNIRD